MLESNPKDFSRWMPPPMPSEEDASGVVGAVGAPAIARRLFVLLVVLFANCLGGRHWAFALEPAAPVQVAATRGRMAAAVAGSSSTAAAAAGTTTCVAAAALAA